MPGRAPPRPLRKLLLLLFLAAVRAQDVDNGPILSNGVSSLTPSPGPTPSPGANNGRLNATTTPAPAVVTTTPPPTTSPPAANTGSQLLTLPDACTNATLVFSSEGSKLLCATPSTVPPQSLLPTATKVLVNVPSISAPITMAVALDQDINFLTELTIQLNVFSTLIIGDLRHLSALQALTLQSTRFEKPNVTLDVPKTLTNITLADTDAVDLSLSHTSQLESIFMQQEDSMQTLPRLFFDKLLSQKVTGTLDISPGVTKLPRLQFEICKQNLRDPNWNITFVENCSDVATSVIGHQVCGLSDDELQTASPGSGGGKLRSSKSSSNDHLLLAVVVIVLGVVVIIIGAVATRRYLGRRALSTSPTNDPSVGLISKDETPSREPLVIDAKDDDILHELRLPQHSVTLTKPLGTGRLWLGEYENHKVIIRRVETEAHDPHVTRDLVAQARILAPLSHPNLVALVGVTWIQGTDFGIVSEFVDRGTLKAVLMDADCELDLPTKLRLCLEVAQGLAYLHSDEVHMYLSRLSSHRVLVTKQTLTCKLNLFDCVRMDTPLTVPEVFGTGEMSWWAPELVLQRHTTDPCAANVFSLGVLMGEILTREPPYATLTEDIGHTLADVELRVRARRQESLVPHEHHPDFVGAPPEVREVINQCLSFTPRGRPTADDVVAVLRTAVHTSERARTKSD